jgi:large subunit ribosomal protein L28
MGDDSLNPAACTNAHGSTPSSNPQRLACVDAVGYSFPVAHIGHPDLYDLIWERTPVAAVCDVCGKRPGFGHNVPWSKKKTNRRWDPNIQRVRAIVAGSPKRLNVCTSCIKAGKVTR